MTTDFGAMATVAIVTIAVAEVTPMLAVYDLQAMNCGVAGLLASEKGIPRITQGWPSSSSTKATQFLVEAARPYVV